MYDEDRRLCDKTSWSVYYRTWYGCKYGATMKAFYFPSGLFYMPNTTHIDFS